MAYVPGYKHDLFLSYSRAESAWVEAFRVALSQAVHERLGVAPDLWQDVCNIRFGQDWTDEIRTAIKGAAAFVSICSPSYFDARAEWCAREYEEFAPDGKLEGLMMGSFCRFLKIVKTPDADEVYKEFYPSLQATHFFNKANEEYLPGSSEFNLNVRQTAGAIAELLRAMRNGKQALYLGSPPEDMQEEWTQLRTQLLDYGYDVRPQVRLTPALASRVERELERSFLAVFLLGSVQDAFVKRQMQAAADLSRRSVVWVHPRKAKLASTDIMAGMLDSAPAGLQAMSQSSIRDFIRDLVELLAAPERAKAAASESSVESVYLMHDVNQPLEAQRADRLRAMISDRKLRVLPDRSVNLTPDLHERLMRECDGLLLYRGQVAGPDKWLFQNVSQVQYAEKMYDLERPLKAKTLLLADPAKVAGVPELDVLPYSEPLTQDLLQPFFQKMNQARGAHVGG